MNYRIEKKNAFKIIAKTQRFVKIEDVNGRKDIPAFWDECGKDGTIQRLCGLSEKNGILGGRLVGMCMEDSVSVKDFPYSIGVEYSGGDVPDGLEVYDIPAAQWAVFDSTGAMPDSLQQLWHKIFSEFFPASQYKPSGNFDFEVYSDDDMNSADYHSEIWIAVENK